MKNKVQLITYPNSLGDNLSDLNEILEKYLKDKIGGVHILPFYPSSSDRGFSPLTHFKVDSGFGNWEDVKKISKNYDLVVDLIINHISKESEIFQDYLKNGDNSKYKDYFINVAKFSRLVDNSKFKGIKHKIIEIIGRIVNFFRRIDKIFHLNGVNRFILKRIYRPRKGSPFGVFRFGNGKKIVLWCTFSNDQVDLDFSNKKVQKMFFKIMDKMSEVGVSLIRLDAVGYAIKKRGTSSFMISETYDLISLLGKKAHDRNLKMLPEVHNHYSVQLKLANQENVDYIYDFCLPPLILYSIFQNNFKKLKKWINIRPDNQITVLDTHDGIGVVDVEGFLNKKEIDKLVKRIYLNGGNIAFRASGENSNNVDIYQINSTYFSALGESEEKYLIARAIQFFIPGIPQVYYVGWLAGKNDEEKLKKTKIGRDVNRHNYLLEEIKRERKRKVVKSLEALMNFRNNYPAFNGDFNMKKTLKGQLEMEWNKDKNMCSLFIDLEKNLAVIKYRQKDTDKIKKWNFVKS